MTRLLHPYVSFPIENNRINFYSDKIFPIDSMLADKDQESAMVSEM